MRTYSTLTVSFALLLAGCGSEGGSPLIQNEIEQTPAASGELVLDGWFDDWVDGARSSADDRWVWLRFEPGVEPAQAIQAAGFSTRLRIDADLDARTGRSMDRPRTGDEAIGVQPQGVDLLIEFSPTNEAGGIGIGTGVTRYDADGTAHELGHAAIGMACLPTYANGQYELRIDRLAPGCSVLPESGKVEMVVDRVDADGEMHAAGRIVVDLPERATAPALRELQIPSKAADGVRVMSANVLFSSPLKDPEPFKRVLDATKPDVILYQEWFRSERAQVEGWLKQYAGDDWRLHFPDEDAGVAIATRHPILAQYDKVLPPSGEGRPARACAALIDTDAGELLAISVHLKCCGAAGSEEDLTRIDQARAINAFVDWVHEQHPDAMVVIAGDFNLVGSRTPLEVMARGLGVGGDDLDPAPARVLGDETAVTWVDEKSRFGPGRLDWMLYDDSRSELEDAFMLNTRVLSDASLSAMGLERDDSKASDHLPMVVDLRRVE